MATAKKTIRIIGAGIYGRPTPENPSGEIEIGTEIEINGEMPAGWVGRAVVVGEEPKEGSVFVTGNGDDPAIDAARREVADEAQRFIDKLRDEHADATRALIDRAEKAEDEVQLLRDQIRAANARLAAFDRDGDGNPGGANGGGEAATADDIKAAVALLDAKIDKHWTAAGLPAVEAVAELTGKHVTRAAITEAAPDAKRPD